MAYSKARYNELLRDAVELVREDARDLGDTNKAWSEWRESLWEGWAPEGVGPYDIEKFIGVLYHSPNAVDSMQYTPRKASAADILYTMSLEAFAWDVYDKLFR